MLYLIRRNNLHSSDLTACVLIRVHWQIVLYGVIWVSSLCTELKFVDVAKLVVSENAVCFDR